MNPGPGSSPTFQNAAPPRGHPPPSSPSNQNPNAGLSASPSLVSPPNSNVTSQELSIPDKAPPQELTPAQLNLWRFDVNNQKKHEKMAFKPRRVQDSLAILDQQHAASSQPPAGSSSGSGSRSSGFMKRLIKAAIKKAMPSAHTKASS
jgi:hypothetical protein